MSWKTSTAAAIGIVALFLLRRRSSRQTRLSYQNYIPAKLTRPMRNARFPNGRFGATTTFIPHCHLMRELSAIVLAFEMPIVLLAVTR